MIFFDHNATTPLSQVAREAWLDAQQNFWHNPSSPYRAAARVRIRLEAARATVGELIGAHPDRVVFTSGATESANAIAHHLAKSLPADTCVAVNPTEHPCVLAAMATAFPGRVIFFPVTSDGVIASSEFARTVESTDGGKRVGAAVVMAANNETGVLLPWSEYAESCARLRIPFVCDVSQWIGKLPAGGLGRADWVFASAHKWGGPKGTGFLLRAADAVGFQSQRGGEQQRGHRGGTEDYPAVASMLAGWLAAEQSQVLLESERVGWRDDFERAVQLRLPGVSVVGGGSERLWNTVSLVMPGHENSRWVTQLDKRGYLVSTGSACAVGKSGPSHVLAALGVSPEKIRRVLRISASWSTTREEWTALLNALEEVARELTATQVLTVPTDALS